MSLSEDLVETLTRTPQHYRRRVYLLAGVYGLLNLAALVTISVTLWQYRLFLTLASRSNAEPLAFLVLDVICGYYVATTWRGALGALRLVYYHLPGATNAEVRKHAALAPATGADPRAYFNLAFEAAEQPDAPIRLRIADDSGMLAELILDGVEARLVATKQGLSNSLFVYVAQQLEARLQARGVTTAVQIVAWSRVDEEAAATYQSRVQAFRALAARLGKGPIWPTQRLTGADRTWLEARLGRLTPTLRDECLLPDVAYGAEYSIPIIPEPLGFIILRRTEQRADAVAALGCAALGLVGIASVLILWVLFPPWIPSR